MYAILDSKLRPLVQNVFFLIDKYTNKITSFINVITSKQSEITEYVSKTYNSVKVTVEGTWMRLDFDNDGSVSVDDLKLSMVKLYEFLKEFDVIETSTQIRSKLYSEAIKYMQHELEAEQRQREMAKQKEEIAKNGEAPIAAENVESDQKKTN